MEDATRRLLEDARRQLADATSEIGQAVSALDTAEPPTTQVLALLGEATSRLSILDGEIARHLGT